MPLPLKTVLNPRPVKLDGEDGRITAVLDAVMIRYYNKTCGSEVR